MAVPATFLDGAMFASGKMSVEELLAKLDSNARRQGRRERSPRRSRSTC